MSGELRRNNEEEKQSGCTIDVKKDNKGIEEADLIPFWFVDGMNKKKKKKRMKEGVFRFTELPTEIQVHVLVRLPLESILKACMIVCKSWNKLIREPSFAVLHGSFHRPLFTIMLLNYSRLLNHTTKFGLVTGNNSDAGSYRLNFTGKVITHMPELEIVGSCNGLICLSSHDQDYYTQHYPESTSEDYCRLVLCNPILGSHLVLPDPPRSQHYGNGAQFGFGYIPSSAQYKAVRLDYKEQERRIAFHICTIQNLGTKMETKKPPASASAWRTIYYDNRSCSEDGRSRILLPPLYGFYEYPTFFRGSIIWLVETNYGEDRNLICFDIEKEQMQTLFLPDTIFGSNPATDGNCSNFRVITIGVYYDDNGNDQLYLCEKFVSCAKIWLMEDYKCIDSVKLQWVIPLTKNEIVHVNLFKVLKDGKVLVRVKDRIVRAGEQDWRLACYDPETNVLETVKKFMLDSEHDFPMMSCCTVDTPNLLGCML